MLLHGRKTRQDSLAESYQLFLIASAAAATTQYRTAGTTSPWPQHVQHALWPCLCQPHKNSIPAQVFPVDVLREAAALGLAGLYVPEEYGGTGLGRLDGALVFEGLSYGDISTAAYLTIHNMVRVQDVPLRAVLDFAFTLCDYTHVCV
jgi:alkylation response protein AidB-like acyl-CoA dehydrogenase